MENVIEILLSVLLVISGIFGLIGSYGLLKLKDTMQRLHAPTKATTVGVGGVLIVSMIYFGVAHDQFSIHELLITLFLFLTAPVSANFLAKTYMVRHIKPSELPESGTGYGWSSYDDPPKGS